MACVLDLGRPAVPSLVAALEAEPTGAGVEAAIAVLGRLGGDDARTWLLDALAARDGVEAFAALALGDCGTQDDRPALLVAATDRLADPQLRAAATASLLRLGCRRDVRSLVRGLLLAGTPAGRELERELGLPHRPRWAYERHLLQLALRDSAGTDFGLDTDAPWSELSRVADAVDRWLESSS